MGASFIIDRRLNPKGKSLGNRQRFIRRARAQIKEAVRKSVKGRAVGDIGVGDSINIPAKGIAEPTFRHATTGGYRQRVLPGNKEFSQGDRIAKPPAGEGGGNGKKASDGGDGQDEFQFALTREEFLDIFFEDLELPDLVKTNLKEQVTFQPHRAGLSVDGAPANLNLLRTMRNSFGRRLALRRPEAEKVEQIKRQIFALEAKSDLQAEDRVVLKALHKELDEMNLRRKVVPYIDPIDLRYNHFQQKPVPNTQAVMFCLMDVSGSMAEREKDLAKRFFMLLHVFLERRYGRIDIVFVRHTHEAEEVDEETFFYSQETGGTIVSTALKEMRRIQKERYPAGEWNIYAAQASDGDDWSGDAERCVEILENDLMPVCQYYAYVEILDQREMEMFVNEANGAELWRAYRTVAEKWPNFATKRIAQPSDIFPVFRELFGREAKTA